MRLESQAVVVAHLRSMVAVGRRQRLPLDWRCGVVMLGLGSLGCGGGSALMHPAHTLPVDTVTFGAGVSGNFVLGSSREAIDDAIDAAPQAGTAVSGDDEERLLKGAFAQTLLSPGVAPWVGARAGLGYTTEAGLVYTGRSVRVDARHAFEGDRVALSVGGGLSGRLLRPGSDNLTETSSSPDEPAELHGQAKTTGEIPGVDDGNLTGWGIDVPVIVGWRSQPSLVQVWGGVRGGYEHLFRSYIWQANPTTARDGDFDGYRWFVGGLVGICVGVDPIWGGVELDAAYQNGRGEVRWEVLNDIHEVKGTLDGFTLTPTGVVGIRF